MNRIMKRTAALSALLFLVTAFAAQAAQLPDFTSIVQKNAPAVVHVEATYNGGQNQQSMQAGGSGQGPDNGMPDIFRHFFGMPVMPQQDVPHMSLGSGFIISSDGYILTNRHVVAGADKVTVQLRDKRILKAKVVGTDKPYDIALLKVDAKDLPTVTIGDSKNLQAGQWVLAIGSPFGFDYTVTQGIVSAVGRSFGPADQQDVPFIQTDVPINRGNSGGPLINLDGQVVGINSQIYSTTGGYMGVSFSIPIDVAMNAVQQLKTKGYVSRGMLGVQLQGVDYDKAKALGMKRAIGALVAKVEPGKPAAKAGVQQGDVIVDYNGHEIDSVADLPPMVAETKPGTHATLTVLRNGKRHKLDVTIGTMPRNGLSASSMGGAMGGSGKLGFEVKPLTSQQRQELDLNSNEGVLISNVTGRQAAMEGLRPGQVVLMVGQQRIHSVSQFDHILKKVKPGDTVMLLVRDQRGTTAFVTISVPMHHH